jgi:hypothetical protein
MGSESDKARPGGRQPVWAGVRRRTVRPGMRGAAWPHVDPVMWSFVDADPLPDSDVLSGWLARTVLALVRLRTDPGDRVLLASGPASIDGPYAGLAEAVWAVNRVGRGAVGAGTEMGSFGLFDLIVTAVGSDAVDWFGNQDWAGVLAPGGTLAVLARHGRLVDPVLMITDTMRSHGWDRRAHIRVQGRPAHDSGGGGALHHLLLFGIEPPTAIAGVDASEVCLRLGSEELAA